MLSLLVTAVLAAQAPAQGGRGGGPRDTSGAYLDA